MRNIENNNVSVIWFEHLGIRNQTYGYGTFTIMKKSSQIEQIQKENIIFSFNNLTGKSKLPVSVLNFLNDYEDIDWKMISKSKKGN